MADTPNTPADSGTGALSIDDAVNVLMTPLTPKRNTGGNDDKTVTPEAVSPDDEDDDTATGTDAAADTEGDQDEPTADDADAGAPDEDTPPAEPSYKVTVDGTETAIPVSELVKGYQRQAVFSKKSQSLADERRAFESERDAVGKERGQYGTLLAALKAQLTGTEREPDWDQLQASDPVAYSVEWARWQQRQQKLNAIESEQRRLAAEGDKETHAKLRAHVEEQGRLLLEKVPEYRDEAVRLKDRDAIRDFAVKTYGYSTDEINSLIDHRAVLVLRDAKAYRALQAKKPAVEKRVVETAAPLSRNRGVPTTSSAGRVKTAQERLNRTGKLQDAVDLEMARSRARTSHGNGSRDS